MENLSLTEQIESAHAFSESAIDFLKTISPLSRNKKFNKYSLNPKKEIWEKIAEAGWTGLLAAEEFGGLELDLRHACAITEQIGRNPLPEQVVGSAIMPIALLNGLPTSELRNKLLSQCVTGELMIGVAWQEFLGKNEAKDNISTYIQKTNNSLSIFGEKKWVIPDETADGWLVSGVFENQPSIWWIPKGIESLKIHNQQRVDGVNFSKLQFNNVQLSEKNLVAKGQDVIDALSIALDYARITQSAELLGIAQAAFDLTIQYVTTRVQFGKPIGSNQALQHRLVDCFIQIQLASNCLNDSFSLSKDASKEEIAAIASRLKSRCLHAALHVTREAIQMHGAIGFTEEYDLGIYAKKALANSSWLGTVSAMQMRYQQISIEAQGKIGKIKNDQSEESIETQKLREEVKDFLKNNYPSKLRNPSHRLRWNECSEWYFTLSKKGWLAPAWPKEYGGMGLPPDQILAFIEEMEDWGVARLPDQGLINLGPVLIKFGTEKQKDYYLPKILSGEHIWCQGYSEPDAGSDLAALRTEAVLDNNKFIVNGQKIWTTLAQDATHIFTLVRTDKNVKKQSGISFLLIDLKSPGINVRPIRNIAGEEEFCEVFFENVEVPQENLVGKLNNGWTIAKALLGFERIFVGSPKTCQNALTLLRRIGIAKDLFKEKDFLRTFTRFELDVEDLKSSYGYFADLIKQGKELPTSVSILKIWASETYTAITRFMQEVADEDGAFFGEVAFSKENINILAPLFTATITTIYAGANEIQRNIIAKTVLKLPV